MKQIEIYTDGACSGNPGPGGWGAILRYNEHEKEISGGEANTTNNRMELSAVINALAMLKEPCKVTLYSDSRYVVDAINKGWLRRWSTNGWRSSIGPVANQELWKQVLALNANHVVYYHWVKGHSGNVLNERCDALATAAASRYTSCMKGAD